MKKLVVYYSYEGNTKLIGEAIANAIEADILQIKLKNEMPSVKFFTIIKGVFQIIFKKKPQLMPFAVNPEEYDVIFLGMPVWGGTFPPPIRTFLSQTQLKDKKIALFCCFAGDEGNCFTDLRKKLLGNEFVGEIGFKEPTKTEKEESIQKGEEWATEIITNIQS